MKKTHTFKLGKAAKVETSDISALRKIAKEIISLSSDCCIRLSKPLESFCSEVGKSYR